MSSPGAEAVAAPPHIEIRPPGRFGGPGLSELLGARELVYFLTKRELQLRYKQSVFGVGWAILQPLVIGFVFALFFGKVAGLESEGFPYAVFAIAGLVPWLFTAGAVQQSAMSLVGDANLLTKVYFPRLVLPISKALGLMLDLAIGLVVVVLVTLTYGVAIEPTAPLVLPFLLLGVVTAFAIGTLFAAINVRYRDVSLIVPVIVQIGLFVTPIIYSGTLITGNLAYLYAVNPMVTVINGVRWALIGAATPDLGQVAVSVASALIILAVALVYFRRTEQFFADIV